MTSADLPKIDPKKLAGWMGVTLYIGGAVKVATKAQRERLRLEVQPLLADTSVPISDVLAKVDEIMGEWVLPKDFDDAINALIAGRELDTSRGHRSHQRVMTTSWPKR